MPGRIVKAFILAFVLVSPNSFAQDFDKVQITDVKVAENIYMLQGQGGNIGLFFGEQGVFIIDDQFAPLHEKITAKVKEITKGKVPEKRNVFVINTHYHGDHTGGNELMGKGGAVLIAHENVRKRLSTEQFSSFFNRTTPPSPDGALPVITFSTGLTFHLNGDSVNVYHVGSAHTDGDAIIHFTKANVIHTGDIVFTNSYPLIDLDGGGGVSGIIGATELILSLSDANTKIIPGHGDMTDKSGLETYHKMLTAIFGQVKLMVSDGRSLEEIQAAKPTMAFDSEYKGFVSGDRFVEIIYKYLTAKK